MKHIEILTNLAKQFVKPGEISQRVVVTFSVKTTLKYEDQCDTNIVEGSLILDNASI
jgi:hypothetical protein